MNVIFLDIDGVMNSMNHSVPEFEEQGRIGHGWLDYKNKLGEDLDHETLRSKCLWGTVHVDALRRIIEETDASVVISSTWRKGSKDIRTWNAAFEAHGLPTVVIDTTPNSADGHRGGEIDEWISDYPTIDYVILDDDHDMLPSQKKYFVQTDFEDGLQMSHAEQAIKILNGDTQ